MRTLLLSVVTVTVLFGYTAEVKKAPVVLKINETTKTCEPQEILELHAGDIVCFLDGDGRVVITGKEYKTQLSKRSKSCKRIPVGKEITRDYIAAVENSIVSVLATSSESESAGVSTKGAGVEEAVLTTLDVSANKSYIVVESKSWGPLPVQLDIVDSKGELVESMENEDEEFTSFIVRRELVKEGYGLRVSNAFDETLLNAKVHMVP